ncbi:MAG: S9 family peptidase [Candidatus Solibacter usitatus]|nr:S9 family peptidase [Candidatus Solibacter usitatus]
MKKWIPILFALSAAAAAEKRPMTFLDVLHFRAVESGTLSLDGKRFAYLVRELDWKAGKRSTDLYLSEAAGAESRRLTYTQGKDERDPEFSPDGQTLGFLSDRESPAPPAAETGRERTGSNHLYLLALAGGEARRISETPNVSSFHFSRDGKWLAFRAGRPDSSRIYLHNLATGLTEALATPETGAGVNWMWSPDSSRIYFTAPDSRDEFERKRMDLKFDVRLVDPPRRAERLWEIRIADKKSRRLTSDGAYTVSRFSVSRDGAWIGFTGGSLDRHWGGLDGAYRSEAYLLEAASGKVERLTSNETPESLPQVSPDGRWVMFSSSQDFTPFRRSMVYVRATGGGEWRRLSGGSEEETGSPAWSRDSRRLYYVNGRGLNQHVFALDLETGAAKQLSDRVGALAATYAAESDQFILTAEGPTHPRDYYLARPEQLGRAAEWRQLSDANPQAAGMALGEYEGVRWKSSDGAMVEGVLVKPLGYQADRRYPLIVQLHGGPAGASINSFSASHGTYAHVFAAGGYAVLQPNYRGSTNYGEKFRMEISGDYFRQAFDDIMTGVDEMIRRGIADPDKLGMMGWSAGGHWSNWTLTHTDRFKAISSGAGAVNWISLYAQTDIQANREFYFKGKPWENWDHYVEVSPLRYIRNAKTPTLIHVGHDDARVPRPQSEELHMALKKLGVPTEFIVYPRMGHGITEPRYQMVKMVSEYNWFEKWINGKAEWLSWKELVESVPK